MLPRHLRACPRVWPSHIYHQQIWRRHASRPFATAAPIAKASSARPLLSALTTDLDRIAPRIDLHADQIEILDGPTDFYEALKARISKARKRIYLSTLYVGKSEHELIATIRQALLHNGPYLKVSILTDALRGTREDPESSCATLLASLLTDFPDRVDIRMYHTPNLTGVRKALVPKRINEGWGLQHMKLYGVDDEIILSGANLSHDYFTNRQDRYHVFKSKRVTEYFSRIHDTVCGVSFQLRISSLPAGHELFWPSANKAPNPLKAPKAYIRATTSLLWEFITPAKDPQPPTSFTSLYPLLVHPPTLNNELSAFTALFQRPLKSYVFTAGYFNPHPAITSALLATSAKPSNVEGTVLTASPYANGFYGSQGISGMLPPAYTHLSSIFLKSARDTAIQLREWQNGVVGQASGWTYHAKGVWITLPPQEQRDVAITTSGAVAGARKDNDASSPPGPSATLIGSSNYTTRSYGLDLEVGALIVTSDESLMRKWKREEDVLMRHTRAMTIEELDSKERRASLKVRIAMWIVRLVGGSL